MGNVTWGLEMNQGVVFRKLKDTIISENEWKVVLDFDMWEIKKELLLLQDMSRDISFQANQSVNIWDEDFGYEYNRIKIGIEQYDTDINDLFSLLPGKRSRRGLVNAGGYVLKWLFGTPTSEDLEHVNNKVEELKVVSGSLVHSRENQLTIMKNMNSKMITNTRAIKEIMEKLSLSHGHLAVSLTGVENEENIMLHRSLSKHLRFTTMLRHLGQTIDEAKLRIVEFRQALELINTGRISSKLLPPHEFANTLYKVEKMLPAHLKMIIPVNIEDIFMYYSFCTVQALATKDGIRLIVVVPLGSADRQFDTYEIGTIPLYESNLNHWLKWDIKSDYLLVSKDRQYFTSIKSSTLNECKDNHFYLCPNSITVFHHTVDDCSFSLFISSDLATSQCRRILTENVTSSFWMQNGNDWIYSLKEPYKVVLNCVNNFNGSIDALQPIEHLELTLNKSGIIKQVSRCDIFGKESRIFSRIQGNVVYRSNITKLHIPNLRLLLPHEEELLSSNKTVMFKTLEQIKNNLKDDSVNIELNKLFAEQHTVKNPITNNNYVYYVIMLVLVIFMNCILFGVYLIYRQMPCCRKCRSGMSTDQTTRGVTINVNDGTPLADILEEVRCDKEVK